ncbi:MAG TPA: CoA-binding protein [Verrucomicrobiae bacterium]|nr:CoA-binding protein [Verrucomicrobiae bacterium]
MAGKLIPWKKKPKYKKLDGSLDTSMSFAVVGSSHEFTDKKHHAYKVFHVLKELRVSVYPVGPDLEFVGKDKAAATLSELPAPVDAVIPCLSAEYSLSIVRDAKLAGINKIWFQTRTLSREALEFCLDNNIEVIEGCVLKHKDFTGLGQLIDPCYWHSKTIALKQKYL